MLETVAIIGPARIGIPLTQAATAPMLGRLEARGWAAPSQVLACAAIRLVHNTATTAFFIWVITGGLDAYAGTYDALGRRVGLDVGTADALVLTRSACWLGRRSRARSRCSSTGAVCACGTARQPTRLTLTARLCRTSVATRPRPQIGAASTRARLRWPRRSRSRCCSSPPHGCCFRGRRLAGVAWIAAQPDREPLPAGLVFAAILAGGAFLFTFGGGLGLDTALRRAARAALLVLTATWLRGAAGAEGLREVSRRALGKFRRVPGAIEAGAVLDQLAAEGRLAAAGRTLADKLTGVPKRPVPFLDAVLAWVVTESAEFKAPPFPAKKALRATARDGLLIALAAAPALTLAYV